MNLKKKQDEGYKVQYKKPEQKSYKQAPAIDWKVMEIDYHCPVPYGKFKRQTLSWIKEADENYYNWILDGDMVSSWGLVKEKGEKKQKKVQHFINNLGEVYIGIRECEGTGILYEDADGKLIQ